MAIQACVDSSIERNMFYERARKTHLQYACFIDSDDHYIIWL